MGFVIYFLLVSENLSRHSSDVFDVTLKNFFSPTKQGLNASILVDYGGIYGGRNVIGGIVV
jgi:hypothetical protein